MTATSELTEAARIDCAADAVVHHVATGRNTVGEIEPLIAGLPGDTFAERLASLGLTALAVEGERVVNTFQQRGQKAA